jgi:hypothetical protein
LESLILLTILEIILIYLIKKISDFNKHFISNIIIIKYIPVKYHNYIRIFDKSVEFNNTFMSLMLVIVIILLLVFILGNLLVSGELCGKNRRIYISI